MRTVFIKSLLKEAEKNSKIMLLTADLGFSVLEDYIQRLPKQYLNVGIAEQNMAGMAAGMAMEGRIPFIYSIVPFTTMRNFEQIRNDICYQNLNVKIVGVGSGFSYGPYGHTHHGLEDIGILRTLPNLTIFSPGDPIEAEFVAHESIKIDGPVYIRLGKAGEPIIHQERTVFNYGKGAIVQDGKDITIIVTGAILANAVKTVEILNKRKISARLISMHTIKPLDEDLIMESTKKTKGIFTIEEHSIIGGLGSAVAEVLAEKAKNKLVFKRFGVSDRFTKGIGKQEYMRKLNGLSAEQIASEIVKLSKV